MLKPSDIEKRALELLKDKPQLSPQALAVIQAVTEAFNAELSQRPNSRHPTLEAVKLSAAKIGLPEAEAESFYNFYTCKGWKVGKNAMQSMPHALANWKKGWQERGGKIAANYPTMAEVKTYAKDKFPLLYLGKFTTDYYGYRSGQKWIYKSGQRIEWQEDFSKQVLNRPKLPLTQKTQPAKLSP